MNYKVYQGTELKQTVTSKTAIMNGLQPNRTYDFSVEADNGQPSASGKTAWARSSDGSDGFSNSYPGENLITRTGELANTMVAPNGNISVYGGSALMADKITVTPGEALTFSRWGDSVDNNFRYGFYTDADVSLIREHSTAYNFTVTVPANATKLKVSYPVGSQVKLERGAIATAWYPSPADDPINAYPRYMGTHTNLTQVNSTNPSDYTWRQIREGRKVTTRGIRFNIPKMLTVGSNITLRYEEYPLGIVPIGNEPSGMFGGGNKQNLSAKVISTANGSSVVEVAGNVIDVGEFNELENSMLSNGASFYYTQAVNDDAETHGIGNGVAWIKDAGTTNRWKQWQSITHLSSQVDLFHKITSSPSSKISISIDINVEGNTIAGLPIFQLSLRDSKGANPVRLDLNYKQLSSSLTRIQATGTLPDAFDGVDNYRVIFCYFGNGTATFSKPKLEFNDIATPYAAFVDGDTFTVQPDGTFALFSEHKALYY